MLSPHGVASLENAMRRVKTTGWTTAATALWLVLATATPCGADLLWFDETDGGGGYTTFGALRAAYDDFLGATTGLIDFNDLASGTQLSNQYADRWGVTFLNTADGRHAAWSAVWPEGGAIAEHVTGYDGTYMPSGDLLYAKFDNDLKNTPFTILFAEPATEVGAFLGMGVEGQVHSLTISVYDVANQLLGRKVVQSWLWEKSSNKQNYETFFAVGAATPAIARVEIRNNATTDFANGLLVDNVEFGSRAVPEPSALVLVLAGVVLHRFFRRALENA